MDGTTMDVGCVGYIRKYRHAISIARYVMAYTSETMLVGEGAESFAEMMGFPPESATTENSIDVYKTWTNNSCQPNFYDNIEEATSQCGPYPPQPHPASVELKPLNRTWAERENHDTIGMVTLRSSDGTMACGTSTNGANHKIAGRIGDSPIPGSGCYVKSSAGGAAATGDGDVMMRFSPSFAAVLYMESGMSPSDACEKALAPISAAFPSFSGGIVCLSKSGEYGAAAYNMGFSYSVQATGMPSVEVVVVA
jgi:N4-(beta-N-acetylglucosaminyl)-L-asparaginase